MYSAMCMLDTENRLLAVLEGIFRNADLLDDFSIFQPINFLVMNLSLLHL